MLPPLGHGFEMLDIKEEEDDTEQSLSPTSSVDSPSTFVYPDPETALLVHKSPYFTKDGSTIPVVPDEASLNRVAHITERKVNTILPSLASHENHDNDPDDEGLVLEQTKRRPGRIQGQEVDQLKNRPGTDTMFPPCEVSASEIHIFLPNMLKCRDATLRVIGNRVTALEQAKAINWAVDGIYDHTTLYSLLRKRSSTWTSDAEKKGVALRQEDRMDTGYWTNPYGVHQMVDKPLLGIAQQVPVEHWPSGLDAGPLTKALQLALDRDDGSLMISMIPKLMAEHDWKLPQESGNRDRQCFDRLLAKMEN